MLGKRIASQSEVIGAIMSGYGPCCGGPAPACCDAMLATAACLAIGQTVNLLTSPLHYY